MSGHGLPPDATTLSEVAKIRGVSRQAVHRRVKALKEAGLLEIFHGDGKKVFVSLSAYDFAIGRHGDPARETAVISTSVLAGAGRAETAIEDSPGYREAKARDAHYSAGLKRLAYEREQRQLYTVDEVNAALERISGRIIEVLGNLNSHADDGMEASELGLPRFRRWLSDLGDDLRRTLAADLRMIEQQAETSVPEMEEQQLDDEP